MALVQFGGGVSAISGKSGGTVYARNRSGAYMRNWAKPTNAPSPIQTANRVRFGNQSQAFATLDTSVQEMWQGLASTITRKNRFGADYVPTGRQLFLEVNNNLAANAKTELLNPPMNVTPPSLSDTLEFTANQDSGTLAEMELSITGVEPDKFYVIDATPLLSTSKNNAVLLFRNIGNFAGSAAVTNLLPAYTAMFGTVAEPGQIIQLRIRALNTVNGIYSTELILVNKVGDV